MIDGDEVKRQAQAGQMGEQLYAVVFKRRVLEQDQDRQDPREMGARLPCPTPARTTTPQRYRRLLAEKMPSGKRLDIVPTEPIRDLQCTTAGHTAVRDDQLARPVLAAAALVPRNLPSRSFSELLDEKPSTGELSETPRAPSATWRCSLDKLRDYNSRMTRWHVDREVVANTFRPP